MIKERITLSTLLLLLATPYCFANGFTQAKANTIIVILIIAVIALVGCEVYSLYYNRIIRQRNEQLRRILRALDEYRALVGGNALSLDEQEKVLKEKLKMPKTAKEGQKDDGQNFFVMMDARINKEKPFKDPDFNQAALAKFMDV